MTYVKTYLPTLKTHVVNLKRDAKDSSRDLQRLEVRGKLGSKTLYCLISRSVEGVNARQRPSFSFPELWYSLLEFNSRKNRQIWRIEQDGKNALKFEAEPEHTF